MLSGKSEPQYMKAPQAVWDVTASLPEAETAADIPTRFHSQYTDCMEMYASAQNVAEYLNAHQGWFCRCAQPMKVEPIGENGYALAIGRFGSFGYEVEPKVGLELLPPDQGIYRINTIAVPDYVAPGYDVDFKAVMELVEQPVDSSKRCTTTMTRVEWQLDLAVYLHFPRFIRRLPKSIIQSTGDRLLNQIVRQVSRRLTYKVQEDFHKSLGLSFPFKQGERG